MQTPPPFVTSHMKSKHEQEALTPPALFQEYDSKAMGLKTPKINSSGRPLAFRRNISSPAGLDDALRIERNIPLSPTANVLQHSLLTPITRNTHNFDAGCLEEAHRNASSTENKRTGDILSTLAIPGASDDFNPTQNPVLSFSVHHPSLNSLPDEIVFSPNQCEVPNESPIKSVSRTSGSPTSREASSQSPEPSNFYHNVSAPSEFFENVAYNNVDQLGGSLRSTRTELVSLFASQNPPALNRGTSLDRPKAKEGLSPPHTQLEPRLQYQPSRRDGSVGISKNTEGVDDIFTQRSPRATNDETTNPSFQERPLGLHERQLSIPSLHRATRLGNDSTASFTDCEYSWEDDDEQGRLADASSSEDQLPLRFTEDHTESVDEELISSAAVGSHYDSLRHDNSILTIENLMEPENTKVVVEVGEEISGKSGQTFITSNQGHGKMKRRHSRRNSDALKWINDLQCGSADKVDEAASSKFLTRGVHRV